MLGATQLSGRKAAPKPTLRSVGSWGLGCVKTGFGAEHPARMHNKPRDGRVSTLRATRNT